MKYRNVLAATAMLGMLAVTGCSRGALPQNNEANYNGERLVRSVSRHTHEMENRVENAAERTTRGFTRGINRNRHNAGNHQNRYSGIRNSQGTNGAEMNRHNRTNPINRNTRGLNRTTEGYREETRRNYANEARYDAERNRVGERRNAAEHNRVNNRTHRMGNDYALNYDANYEQTVPVSLNDEGTANFFKKNGAPKTGEPTTVPVPNTPTSQPAQ